MATETAPLEPAARRLRNPLPTGTIPVAIGLAVAGLGSYAFLAIASHAMPEEQYDSLGVLWAFVFLIGPGFYIPVEQEVGRAVSERRALGLGGAPVIFKAAQLAFGLAAILLVGSLIGAPALLEHLFDDKVLLLVGYLMGLVAYALVHLTRGVLSGNGRFTPYGLIFGGEGLLRLLGCVVLAVIGVETAGPYGIAMGIAPFLAVTIGLWGQRGLLTPGPPAKMTELSQALGWLLLASVSTQALVNCAPLAARILADESDGNVAARILNGLLVARIPLFFFQAVQAALLPKLAALAAESRFGEFRDGLKRLLAVVVAIGVLGTAGALVMGPWVVDIMFGSEGLGRGDLGYLAAGSALIMLGLTFAQALVALGGHARAAFGWIVGVVAFLAVTALPGEVLDRVGRGFLAGTAAAAILLAILCTATLKARDPDHSWTLPRTA
jgi:O-antigen/teichoic acid export membrane protein